MRNIESDGVVVLVEERVIEVIVLGCFGMQSVFMS